MDEITTSTRKGWRPQGTVLVYSLGDRTASEHGVWVVLRGTQEHPAKHVPGGDGESRIIHWLQTGEWLTA